MNASQLALISGYLIAAYKIFCVLYLWNFPLNHGPGYFFLKEVPPGFYEQAGLRWLRGYRALLVLQCLLVEGVWAALLLAGQPAKAPVMAPVDVISLFALIGGFTLWARRSVGLPPATVLRVAVPLETRRLGDYIWWPAELLMAAVIAASWLLLVNSGARFDWGWPVVSTYVVLAFLPGKILLVRNSFPLPPERTEEYQCWLEYQRRFGLRVMDAMRWSTIVPLAGYALLRGPAAAAITWVRWLVPAAILAVVAVMMAIVFHGMRRTAVLGRDLRPVGSFQTPFRPASMWVRGGLVWGIVYCAGLAVLLMYFQN